MSSDQNKPNNVIQFPGRRKEAEPVAETLATDSPIPSQPEKVAAGKPAPPVPRKKKSNKKTVAGTVLAIILATGAVNKFAFESKVESMEFISDSRSATPAGRGIASVGSFQRDAQWEKETAEKLASPALRAIASTNIGRPATLEENLRWGTLEEAKYTITYKPDSKQIHSIFLQGETSDPSYILDRAKFLKEYGSLFDSSFSSATLKSVESINERTVESYTLFDKNQHAAGEVRFELDRHKRLLSLKVEPTQI